MQQTAILCLSLSNTALTVRFLTSPTNLKQCKDWWDRKFNLSQLHIQCWEERFFHTWERGMVGGRKLSDGHRDTPPSRSLSSGIENLSFPGKWTTFGQWVFRSAPRNCKNKYMHKNKNKLIKYWIIIWSLSHHLPWHNALVYFNLICTIISVRIVNVYLVVA